MQSVAAAERIPLAEWAHLHAYLIWIYEGPPDPVGLNDAINLVPHLTAWHLLNGQVEARIGSARMKASEGEWLFLPPGRYWRRFSNDARIISVRFRASWPSGEELFSQDLGLNLSHQQYPNLLRSARKLAAFVRERFPQPDTHLLSAPATLGTHLRLQALFAAWLDASVEALTGAGLVPARMGRMDPRLLRAIQLVEHRNLALPFSEPALAKEIGLSVSQLNRLFRHQFQVSSRGFFERRRQEQAIAALQSSSQSIKEVAGQLGFSSLPHFSAWSKRKLGQSPRSFRAQFVR